MNTQLYRACLGVLFGILTVFVIIGVVMCARFCARRRLDRPILGTGVYEHMVQVRDAEVLDCGSCAIDAKEPPSILRPAPRSLRGGTGYV